MEIGIIKQKIKTGDMDTASQKAGITRANGYKALERVNSKHHENIVKALAEIITKREELIEAGI